GGWTSAAGAAINCAEACLPTSFGGLRPDSPRPQGRYGSLDRRSPVAGAISGDPEVLFRPAWWQGVAAGRRAGGIPHGWCAALDQDCQLDSRKDEENLVATFPSAPRDDAKESRTPATAR